MGESISGLSIQAAVFKPRKYAGTKQEGNEGHFNQHRNVVQQSKVLKTEYSKTRQETPRDAKRRQETPRELKQPQINKN